MNTVTIPAKNVTKEVPSCISELNERQYLRFVQLLLQLQANSISFEDFKNKLTFELLDIKVNAGFYFLSFEERVNAYATIYQLTELADSFFKEELKDHKPVKVAQLSFVKQLIPKIGRFDFAQRPYYGPADALQDITFCEYRLAHDHFTAFVKTEDPAELDHMIAVLYRRRKLWVSLRKFLPGYDGQQRRRITSKSNPAYLERRVKNISRIPFHIRYGIFLWFAGCEEYLVTGRPEINGHEIDFAKLYEKSDKGSSLAEIGLVGILYSLAETKVFGNMEETDNQNLYDVLLRLWQVVMQTKDIEDKYSKK